MPSNVADRISDMALSTFESELKRNLPSPLIKSDVKEAKENAWDVVCNTYPITKMWRDDYALFMKEVGGLRGMKGKALPPSAERWRRIINASGGILSAVYKNGKPDVIVEERKKHGRNMRSVNNAVEALESWIEDHDYVPSVDALSHFCDYETPLWLEAMNLLTERGYAFTSWYDDDGVCRYHDVTERPTIVEDSSLGEIIREYLQGMPKDKRLGALIDWLNA